MWADVVECPYDATLQERPVTFDCLSVNVAPDVLQFVVDDVVRAEERSSVAYPTACFSTASTNACIYPCANATERWPHSVSFQTRGTWSSMKKLS